MGDKVTKCSSGNKIPIFYRDTKHGKCSTKRIVFCTCHTLLINCANLFEATKYHIEGTKHNFEGTNIILSEGNSISKYFLPMSLYCFRKLQPKGIDSINAEFSAIDGSQVLDANISSNDIVFSTFLLFKSRSRFVGYFSCLIILKDVCF